MTPGSTCTVFGCHSDSKKMKLFSESFCSEHQQLRKTCPCPVPYTVHSMPTEEGRRRAWLTALRLKKPPKRVYVCSFHFVDKRPTEQHPDPELYLGYNQSSPPTTRRKQAGETQAADRDVKVGRNFTSTVSDHAGISYPAHTPEPQCPSVPRQRNNPTQRDHDYCQTADREDVRDNMTCEEIGCLMLQSDADSFHYTGVALRVFNMLVSMLEGHASDAFTMSVRVQVLITLVKLKNNHAIDDLSSQFRVTPDTARKIILYWINKLEVVLQPLIPWLPKETIQATSPEEFKKSFPNTTCIVDCSETLLEKAENSESQETYSECHSHYPVKYLVAVAPCGLIMFISPTYGCRCSDKFITIDSGILDLLTPGDEVMSERCFALKDLLFQRKIKLVTHSSTNNHRQQITNVRIHVERAIRRLKVYKILSEVVSFFMASEIDNIIRICAALVNLRVDLIHDPI